MKIGILSDFHLGYERFRDDAYNQAGEALRKACELSDMIIIPGDIFDFRHPKPEVIAEAITLFARMPKDTLNSAKVIAFEGDSEIFTSVPIIAIPGTHERRAQDSIDPVDLLNLAGLLVDVGHSRATVEKKDSKEKVSVYGIGGVSDERFREVLSQLNPSPLPGAFNILLFHQSIFELLPFSKDFLHIDELPEGFDLYIDGHIHNKVVMKCHGKPFLIPGSTVLTQLKDGEQEKKGFFIFDTSDNSYTFHNINSRYFTSVKLDITDKGHDDINGGINIAIKKVLAEHKDKPVIRIELGGKLSNGIKNIDINTQEIQKAYSDKAIIEIKKPGIESGNDPEIETLRHGMLENTSIRDYGLGIFMEKLEDSKLWKLKISPSMLFDMLSAEGKKENAIEQAIHYLFEK